MLAIVIPYFKLTFFEETLQSLANQTDQRFKVYIGDDASPEKPADLLEKYKGKFDFIYHRFEENLGGTSLTQQWDRCIALSADEEWIMILGDDDVLGENVVEEFYNEMEEIKKYSCHVVKFASQTNDFMKKTQSEVFLNPKLEYSATLYFKKFKGKQRSSLSEHIFCREVYLKYRFKDYPLAWHSDDYAWLTFSNSNPIYCINGAVVKVKVSSISISGNRENLILKNIAESQFFMDVIRTKLSFFKRKEQLELLYQTEVLIKNNRKPTQLEWQYLAIGYLNNFSFVQSIKFIRRYFKKI